MQSTPSTTIQVPCAITPKDILEMDYWLSTAPMADPSRENAFSFALNRMLIPDVSVTIARHDDCFEAIIGPTLRFPLSERLSTELCRAFTGYDMKPMVEWVRIPKNLLIPSIRRAYPDAPAFYPTSPGSLLEQSEPRQRSTRLSERPRSPQS